MSDLKTVNGMEDLELKNGNQMMGEYQNQNPTLKQTASLRSGEGQINGLTRGDSTKVRETAASRRDPSNDNLYVKAMKRIIYLSLVIWSAGFRKLVETVTGVKLPRIHIDHRMVEGHRRNPDWVSFPEPL